MHGESTGARELYGGAKMPGHLTNVKRHVLVGRCPVPAREPHGLQRLRAHPSRAPRKAVPASARWPQIEVSDTARPAL